MQASSPTNAYNLDPLLWLAVSFAAGIIVGNILEIPFLVTVPAVIMPGVLAVVLRERPLSTSLILISFFMAGSATFAFEQFSDSPDRIRQLIDDGRLISGDPIEVEGRLTGAPEPGPDGYFLVVKTERVLEGGSEIAAGGHVRIFVPLNSEEASYDFSNLNLSHGSRVRIACLLEREDRYLNPGVYPRKLLLDRQGIDATANLKSPLLIEKIAEAKGIDRFAGAFFELRAGLIQEFRELFSPPTAGVLIASLLGNKYFLDKQTADVFREGGTFHVLVISGLHITFIGGLLLLLALLFTRNRWLQTLVTVSILWFYGIAVGADVPVIRACVMFTILMVGYAEFQTASLLNSLGASSLVLLAWRPSDIFDPSFQLTFVSVAAIVAVGLPLSSKLNEIGAWMPSPERPFPPNAPRWLRRLCETIYWNEDTWTIHRGRQVWKAEIVKSPLFARLSELGLRRTVVLVFEGIVISAAVQVCLLPLLVYYFHRFPLASIPMNLWVGGVLAAESISAVVAVVVATLSETLAFPFVALAEFFNWMIVALPSIFTTTVFSNTRFPIYSGPYRAIYIVYFIPLVMSAIILLRWDPFAIKKNVSSGVTRVLRFAAPFVLLILGGIILLHPLSAPAPDSKLHFDFLDVGQGDAALVTFPSGKTMLIDAGGKLNYRNSDDDDENEFEPDVPRVGEMVVSEFLWERGISRIDTIVATHADADHIQGLTDIVRNFSVGNAYLGRVDDDPELKPLLIELGRFHVKSSIVSAGDSLKIEGVRIDVLNPFDDGGTANNGSIVLKFTFGENTFLLTGDIERDAEDGLLKRGADLVADVIKVPHHGSRSSSTEAFVNSVRPRFAVISVGRRSVFGHPHSEVVERWKAAGAEVLTTGERGTVTVVSDGKEISVSRFK
jgi:competence protein ComEC